MIKRKISQPIKRAINEYPVILLTGPRQSGKTTLVKFLFPELPYANLEDLETREYALNDPKGFLNQYQTGMIIDEVQRVPELLSQIQVIVDKRKIPGQFILTGSQNMLLLEQASQSLAGRVGIFNLLPLSLSEFADKPGGLSDEKIETLMFKGMYPKLHDQTIEIPFYYSNYVRTYVERDVRLLKNITNLNTFKRFLNLCAGRCGQILNYSSLAQDAGISQSTVKDWVSILEAGFIIFLLRPHYKNFNKRVVKMPKLYFYDTGLVCSLLNISESKELSSHYLKGGIFESFIISEFIKNRYNQGQDSNAYYWRNKSGNEIDLLLEKGESLSPIEIKSGETISSDYFKGLKYYNKLAGTMAENSYVIYAGKEKQKRQAGSVIPWNDLPDFLKELN
jgi:predicted AAA+ superfamily ATPase